ncbi:MAG: TrmH family RNA methyltransferase [Candidatus Actinomarina sp.]|nr:RNA methyltransferase [Candidatus Actinomarinales bacterium]|tara:strand:+ start:364 stop:1095 length:732 start_codon:yes stop_codon:yes gene_type:complete
MGLKVDGVGQLVEGVNALEAALSTNRVKKVYLLESPNNTSSKYKNLLEILRKKNLEIEVVKDQSKWNFHSRHNIVGICNEKKIYNETNFEQILKNKVLILDHIQDTNNFGAIVRSAAAFGFETIFIPKKRSVKITERTFTIASGGMEYIDIVLYNSIFSLLKKIKSNNYWTIGLDMNSKNKIKEINLVDQKIALVLGSEQNGISLEIQKKLDLVAQIDMSESIESLNASVAAAIAMHQIFIKK